MPLILPAALKRLTAELEMREAAGIPLPWGVGNSNKAGNRLGTPVRNLEFCWVCHCAQRVECPRWQFRDKFALQPRDGEKENHC